MKLMRFLAAAMLSAALAAPAAAQSTVTTSDLQRLQDTLYDASRDVAQVRSRDSGLASQLQNELDDARDETVYLKVKLRKNEPIATTEYGDLRDRIENIRSRARGDSGGGYTPPPAYRDSGAPRPASTVGRGHDLDEIAVGTEFDVRLQTGLSSGTSLPEDVNTVTKATRTERTGKLTVAFDRVTIDHRSYPIRATVTQALQSEGIMGEKERIGIGAGAGAILGAILGGAKGAVAGILIGGGGTIAATEGKDVELPAGTVLRVRLDSPLTLQRGR